VRCNKVCRRLQIVALQTRSLDGPIRSLDNSKIFFTRPDLPSHPYGRRKVFWRRNPDRRIAFLERNNPRTPLSPFASGHENLPAGKCLLDYKPKARDIDAVKQLVIYALAFASRARLPVKAFKCAWFDEKDFFEFFPLQAVRAKTSHATHNSFFVSLSGFFLHRYWLDCISAFFGPLVPGLGFGRIPTPCSFARSALPVPHQTILENPTTILWVPPTKPSLALGVVSLALVAPGNGAQKEIRNA
jgi:hypothetical protein